MRNLTDSLLEPGQYYNDDLTLNVQERFVETLCNYLQYSSIIVRQTRVWLTVESTYKRNPADFCGISGEPSDISEKKLFCK